MTYDDWKLRSDRDEYPEPEPPDPCLVCHADCVCPVCHGLEKCLCEEEA
jgi:hypothetical protein